MQNTEPDFNLIDVMRGIHAMALCTHLTAPQFTFLINLILKSNELAFKNPLSLTNAQACALSSCQSKQGIYKIRQSLSKKKIDGEWLLKVKSGKGWENRAATYEMNLKFLASYSNGWQGFIESRSTNEDQEGGEWVSSVVARGSRPVDHSKIREDKIRTTTTEGSSSFDASLPEGEEEQEPVQGIGMDLRILSGAILKKWGNQLAGKEPSVTARTSALEDFPLHTLTEAIDRGPLILKNPSPTGALNCAISYAKNPKWGVTQEEEEVENLTDEIARIEGVIEKVEALEVTEANFPGRDPEGNKENNLWRLRTTLEALRTKQGSGIS